MAKIINWAEVDKKAGRPIEEIYGELKSTRALGRLLGLSCDTLAKELKRRGIELVRGGRNNSKENYAKPKSGRVCNVCGEDPYPNWFRCRTCNKEGSWTESYGFSL